MQEKEELGMRSPVKGAASTRYDVFHQRPAVYAKGMSIEFPVAASSITFAPDARRRG